MIAEPLKTPSSKDAWEASDEIDLLKYLDVLIRWWREIVLITVGTMVLGAVVIVCLRLLLPPVYEASADVAIVRTVSNVSFDERFQTSTSIDELGTDIVSISARRSALLGLAVTGSIAQEVLQVVGNRLDEEEQDPAVLVEMVSAEAGPIVAGRADSDLIHIKVTADAPEKAAAVANVWAQAYVRQINIIYGQVSDEAIESIQAELESTKATYLKAQRALENFMAEDRAEELTNLAAVLRRQLEQEISLVQSLWARWQRINEQLDTAMALRAQVERGGDASARSNMMALQSLKLTIYGISKEGLQVELRDIPEVTQAGMLGDLDGLIHSLKTQLIAVERDIDMRSNGFRTSLTTDLASAVTITPTLSQTYSELRQLASQIENQKSQQQQLEQQRNLSWEAYKSLSNKVAELSLARAAASSEVRFAAAAVAPNESLHVIGLIAGTGISGVVGIFLAFITVFLSDFLGQPPFLSSKR